MIRNFYTLYIYIYIRNKKVSILLSTRKSQRRTTGGGRARNEITTVHRHRNRVPVPRFESQDLWPNVQQASTIETDRKRPIASIILFGTVQHGVSCACVCAARRVYKRAYSRVNSLCTGSTRPEYNLVTTRCNFCSSEF